MRDDQAFPQEHLDESRSDAALQEANRALVEELRREQRDVACPECGAAGEALAWFFFESPAWTWEHLCGRAGVVAFCDRDRRQVAFFLTMMN